MADLEKGLSFPIILLITINSIMGTGIFFLPAIGAATAGPASILSWLAMVVIAMGMAYVFAELSSMYPSAGGVYEYCKQAFGAFPSFIIGWITLIVANVTIAMLVVGAIRYLNPLLPTLLKIGFSILFILLFNFMAYRGLQTSAVMLVAFALITLISVLGLIIPGFFHFSLANLAPFFTHPPSAVLLTIFLVSETFFGWETATFLAEETQDAKRVIPKALLLGTGIISVIVIVFVLVSLATVHWVDLGASPTPLSLMAQTIYGTAASPIFSILVYVSIIGSVAGWIVSAPRLIMSLAKDKMFIEQLADIHPVRKTPYKAIVFQTILTSILVVIGAGAYETLLHLLLPLVLIMYSAVVISLLVMRVTKKDHERLYKLPFAWISGTLLVGALVFLTGFWIYVDPTAMGTVAIAGALLLAGIPVYILLKLTYDADAVMSFTQGAGKLQVLLEDVLVPKSIRKDFFLLANVTGKRVLEFGANVGTMTLSIAEKTGPKGTVIATELSKKNAKIVQKRIAKKGHSHVTVLHDQHQVSRLHPDVEEIDVVMSIGFLSYVQDLPRILKDIKSRLTPSGSLIFVEYVDFFKILPNTGISANPKNLEQMFLDQGFSVTVRKKKGLLWNYLIVHALNVKEDVPFI